MIFVDFRERIGRKALAYTFTLVPPITVYTLTWAAVKLCEQTKPGLTGFKNPGRVSKHKQNNCLAVSIDHTD